MRLLFQAGQILQGLRERVIARDAVYEGKQESDKTEIVLCLIRKELFIKGNLILSR